MIIGITGATGFVGRHIVHRLIERGHRVRTLVRRPERASFKSPDVEIVPGSLSDTAALRTLVTGADAVVHLVGIIVERGADTFDAVHVAGTAAVIAAARAAGVRRLVHMSALGARDEPSATAYHRTKARGEQLALTSGLDCVSFRPSLIAGPGSAPISILARLHRFAPVVPIFGSGKFPLQPVWIGDVATAFALAAEGRSAGVLELGGPAVMTYVEYVRAIGRACGHPRATITIPLGLVRLLARAMDPLGAAAPITSDQLQMLVEGSVTPNNAIERVFGIKPLRFEEGLARFL